MPASPDPAPAAVLRLRGVGVRVGGRALLRGVDWQVGPGQHWVVVGPNGSGKTTLVRVAGLARPPTTGTVEVLGFRLGHGDVRAQRRHVALAGAALTGLPPGAAAWEVVATGLSGDLDPVWHPPGAAERGRALAAMDRLGIAALADSPLGVLSSGERQRLLLARALVGDPGVVLLDEPAAGLDLGGREALAGVLTSLAGPPPDPALVLVTHHLEEIPAGFTHALALRSGKVLAAGPIAEVLDADVLSDCFGLPLDVRHEDGRWRAWARRPGPAS